MAIASAVVLGIVLLLCSRFAAWLLRTTLPIAFPLAFCVLVALETWIMNTLSVFHGVTAAGILSSHALVAVGGVAFLRQKGQLRRLFEPAKLRRRVAWALRSPVIPYLLPIIALLYLVALIYPPHNYDSLTYHMGRVVYWLENRSVDFFHTQNQRQNGLGPGAEYLLLTLQALTDSDRLANCVQTSAYVILVMSITLMTRYIKAPRALRVPLVVLFATTPNFVLEATTTQNDLCAAVASLGVLTAVRRPLFGRESRMTPRELLALALALGASYIIKPTALVLIAPLLALAGGRLLLALIRRRNKAELFTIARGLGLGLAVGVSIVLPHALRVHAQAGALGPVADIIFPSSRAGLSLQRLLNPLLVVPHHLPIDVLSRWIGKVHASVRELPTHEPWWLGAHFSGHVFRQYEDLAGAPLQFVAIIVLSTLGFIWVALRRGTARNTTLLLALLPPLTWLFFHWVAKNNQWIARYHAPWFAMGVLTAFGASQLARQGKKSLMLCKLAAWGFAAPALVYGWSTIIQNEMRPVSTKAFKGFDRVNEYYWHARELKAEHDRVLKVLETRKCNELVIDLGGDDVIEYPLTWRAWQAGVTVYQRPGPEHACLLYAPKGLKSAAWRPVRANDTKIYKPAAPTAALR